MQITFESAHSLNNCDFFRHILVTMSTIGVRCQSYWFSIVLQIKQDFSCDYAIVVQNVIACNLCQN
jgi:hypothetical protein